MFRVMRSGVCKGAADAGSTFTPDGAMAMRTMQGGAWQAALVVLVALAAGCGPEDRPGGANGAPEPRSPGATPGANTAAVIERDGIGPVRLGMTVEEARAIAGARDTIWMDDEGMESRDLVVPVDGAELLALVLGGRIERIHLREEGPRTPEGLGIGSTAGELHAAYGPACAGEGHGRLVLWFPNAPGISFQVEVPEGEDAYRLSQDPGAIPDGVRVTELWVRDGHDDC
jgi:hypothetical protein